jgi:hypothetical protein
VHRLRVDDHSGRRAVEQLAQSRAEAVRVGEEQGAIDADDDHARDRQESLVPRRVEKLARPKVAVELLDRRLRGARRLRSG